MGMDKCEASDHEAKSCQEVNISFSWNVKGARRKAAAHLQHLRDKSGVSPGFSREQIPTLLVVHLKSPSLCIR